MTRLIRSCMLFLPMGVVVACSAMGDGYVGPDSSVLADATPDRRQDGAAADGGTRRARSPLCGRSQEACALGGTDCSPGAPDAGSSAQDAGMNAQDAATAPRDASAQDAMVQDAASRDAGTLSDAATSHTSDAGAPIDKAARCSSDETSTFCEAAGQAQDGAKCGRDADCENGLVCVESAGGSVCRRLCCDANCSSDGMFCDLRTTTTKVLFPVCMPVAPCSLLNPTCGPKQTCAPVREGVNSCVDIGPAAEGAECDTRQCQAGLACLGVAGSRKCKTICQAESLPCGGNASCVVGYPYFNEDGFGVCTEK